ncbi:glutamate racemase [Gelidibacter salicanalis]|uniref:Glutamate racemase n=1 Tax=Gelidibacter salicanalis TaxID=291193 RepID=A0A934NC55_9FLAO|nr:glutamate racemase [Gelidibacter salicanalis]MBJ7880365.1 glutamate racemase [Gelidibacter salicanalis]
MSTQPIGIFDSGIGGTSIFKEIKALLPHEHTLYLADSFNAPYGNKSKDEIIALSIKNTKLLISKDCKLIVVACNTATTNAIKELRDLFDIPFVGIEPAIKPAALSTQTKAIGILATKGTLSSELFHKSVDLYSENIKVIEQVGNGIVSLIEEGRTLSEDMKSLLQIYLKPMLEANIDYLVLGCTHYPYLMPLLLEILPEHVKIIDSGQAVARQTKAVLVQNQLLNEQTSTVKNEFYTNGTVAILKAILDAPYDVNYLKF